MTEKQEAQFRKLIEYVQELAWRRQSPWSKTSRPSSTNG